MIQMVTLDSKKVALEIAKQNYTIKDFSKKCGVHRSTISEIINSDNTQCKLLIACKIANALNLEVADLTPIDKKGRVIAGRTSIPWYGDKEYAERKIDEMNSLFAGTGIEAKLYTRQVGNGHLQCEEYMIVISK